MEKETERSRIEEIQLAEQNLQVLFLQKQAFQLELRETESALKETENTSDDIYKITGQIMLKAKKEEILKELKEKQEILKLRIKSIEKQEALLQKKAEEIKKELEERFRAKKTREK